MKILRTRIALNHSAPSDLSIGTAANVAPIDNATDEWTMIAPYGEFPNPLGIQVLNREYAEKMVTAFNSIFAKLGRLFRGVPIYRGHPDVMPERWPDDRRYGRYTELKAGDDGLYGKPAWNSTGKENITEGFYVYPSPAWHFAELGNGRIAPTQLVSVGLTNTPNIPSVRPLTNTAPVIMNKKLAEALGLKPDATDEEILTAINALLEKQTTASNASTEAQRQITAINTEKEALTRQLTAANTATTQAQDDAKKFRTALRDLQIHVAVNEGRLPAAEVPAFNTKFDADFDAAAKELAERKKALNTTALNLNRTATGADFSTPEGRRLAFNARIDALTAPVSSGGKGLGYDAAINAMKANPEDAALLKAMEAPTAS